MDCHVATLLAETLIYDRHLFKITITAGTKTDHGQALA